MVRFFPAIIQRSLLYHLIFLILRFPSYNVKLYIKLRNTGENMKSANTTSNNRIVPYCRLTEDIDKSPFQT